MGIENSPHNQGADMEALQAAIKRAEALLDSENTTITIPGLHETDRASRERVDTMREKVSISGRGVYSLFTINREARVLESESFASIDDTREDDDKRIHAERIELLRRKFA